MKFIAGLLLGLGLGFVVGLLFAPQSGEATRAQLRERGILLNTEELRARATEAFAQGRELYGRTKGELSERYNEVRNQ
jgi:gas vesicle protein